MGIAQPSGPTSLNCPSCGAALPDGGNRRECVYCGTIVELPSKKTTRGLQQPARPAPAPVQITFSTSSWAPAVSATTRKAVTRRGGSCVVSALLLLIPLIAGVLFFSDLIPFQRIASSVSPISTTGKVAVLASDDAGAASQVVSVVRDTSSTYHVALFDTATSTRLWMTGPVGDSAISYGQFAWNADTIAFVDERTLYALKRSDGAQLWKVTLTDRLCDRCLLVAGDAIVTLAIDNHLTGVDLASGEVLWTKTADRSTASMLIPVDASVAIIARDDEALKLSRLDPGSGDVTASVPMACRSGELTIDPSPSDPIWYNDGTLVMYTSFGQSCLHAYDMRAGRQVWQQVFENDQAPQSSMTTALRHIGDKLWIGGYGALLSTSLSDGATRLVAQNDEYWYNPLSVRGSTVLADVTRTVGTRRHELWGIDSATGKTLWKHTFRGDGDLLDDDDSGTISRDEDVWTWTDTPAQFALVTMASEPNMIQVAPLDAKTGQLAPSEATIDLGGDTFWRPTMLHRDGARLWYEYDNKVNLLDTDTATIVYSGP